MVILLGSGHQIRTNYAKKKKKMKKRGILRDQKNVIY